MGLVAVFAVEVALTGLAVAHARSGRFGRVVWWAARVLVGGAFVVSIFAVYEAMWEVTTLGYPWTLPGRPLGRYAEPTIMGVGLVAVDGVLFMVAGLVALFRPRVAALLLVAIALSSGVTALLWLSDPTAPAGNAVIALVVGPTLPAVTIASLVWWLPRPLLGGPGD